MLAFVTGATGFVASHVARVLAEQGADLRLLVRSSSDLRNIEGLKADRAVGDLRDPASLEKAMAGCDVVFHVAADYRLWVRDPEQMYRSNVGGTRAILEAARKNGVGRVVYTSSVATMGFTSNGHAADENSPVAVENMIGPYKRSKFMAEQIAMEAGRGGMDVVVVNPTTPVGERVASGPHWPARPRRTPSVSTRLGHGAGRTSGHSTGARRVRRVDHRRLPGISRANRQSGGGRPKA